MLETVTKSYPLTLKFLHIPSSKTDFNGHWLNHLKVVIQ